MSHLQFLYHCPENQCFLGCVTGSQALQNQSFKNTPILKLNNCTEDGGPKLNQALADPAGAFSTHPLPILSFWHIDLMKLGCVWSRHILYRKSWICLCLGLYQLNKRIQKLLKHVLLVAYLSETSVSWQPEWFAAKTFFWDCRKNKFFTKDFLNKKSKHFLYQIWNTIESLTVVNITKISKISTSNQTYNS